MSRSAISSFAAWGCRVCLPGKWDTIRRRKGREARAAVSAFPLGDCWLGLDSLVLNFLVLPRMGIRGFNKVISLESTEIYYYTKQT